MRDLLDISGPAIVVALSDHAFAIIKTGNDNKGIKLVQLSPPKSESVSATDKQTQPQSPNVNEVQAVSSRWLDDKKVILCAVSRYNKCVSLYSISLDDLGELDHVEPVAVHKTNKRCCALSFASIPFKDESEASLDIIVTADYSGDVHAFPVASSPSESKNMRRLLLGHTASMLTAIKIVGGRIFTADRDEKVRITSFPDTYNVQGYLLGNTEYVTDIDVFDDGKYCVTSSGDYSIRLWDCDKFAEVASLNLASTKNNDNQEEEEDKKALPQIPVRVAVSSSGDHIAVISVEKSMVDVFAIKKNGEICDNLERIQSIPCPTPLALAFDQSDELYVLTGDPKFMVHFIKNPKGDYVLNEECECVSTLRGAVENNNIVMPECIIEVDQITGKFKLTKNIHDERENFVEHKPWMNKDRVQKQKDKERRRKKRKQEVPIDK